MTKFGIGQAVRRVEDQRFLTGAGRYIDDINLPGQAYGVPAKEVRDAIAAQLGMPPPSHTL